MRRKKNIPLGHLTASDLLIPDLRFQGLIAAPAVGRVPTRLPPGFRAGSTVYSGKRPTLGGPPDHASGGSLGGSSGKEYFQGPGNKFCSLFFKFNTILLSTYCMSDSVRCWAGELKKV